MIETYELKLLRSFNGSFINCYGEFIAHKYSNKYFILRNCKNELDVKCKVLEWFSRAAFKEEPYRTRKKNEEFNDFMLKGINTFLDTNFTKEEMKLIYCELGNCVNHKLTVEFINSGFDMNLLND